MDLGLTDAVAVITGGGSGIGEATARLLSEEGVKVALLGRRADRLEAVAQSIVAAGGEALAMACDVADDAATAAAIRTVAEHYGQIDLLHCCAGISGLHDRTLAQLTVPEWDRMMAVNVRGQWLPVKHACPYLRASGRAAIVIVASDSSFVASPQHVPYCTSKGAVLMLTRALAVDLRPDGIRVNCVCPSLVDTDMARASLDARGHGERHDFPVQSAREVAGSIVFLSAPISRPVNGHALVSDFGYMAQSGFPA